MKYVLRVVGQPSCATLRSKSDKVLSFETKLRRGGFEMGRQEDGFETVSNKKEFEQSGLTWLYSGDPATRLDVLGPFR